MTGRDTADAKAQTRLARGGLINTLAGQIFVSFASESGLPVFSPCESVEIATAIVGFSFSNDVADRVEKASCGTVEALQRANDCLDDASRRRGEARKADALDQARALAPFLTTR